MQTLNLIVMVMLGLIIILEAIAIALLLFRKIELPELAIDSIKKSVESSMESSIKIIKKLPQDVLDAITKSKAAREGHLLELLAVMSLTEYDRVFYFGSRPIDYIGIKYDSDKAGVYFIEIKKEKKEGKKHQPQLSSEEKQLQKLIEEKKVYYLPLSVSPVAVAEDISEIVEARRADEHPGRGRAVSPA